MSDNNQNGNGRWQGVLSAIAAGAVIIGALVSFFVQSASLSTQVSIDAARIVTMEAAQSAANERIPILRADMSQTRADLREVETQFCGSDIVRNLMHANDMRVISMSWHNAFPSVTLPIDNAYYPRICNRDTSNGMEHTN
jgi:hypothetical protein